MATRGHFVLISKGRWIVVYVPKDSDVEGLGMFLVEDLTKLFLMFSLDDLRLIIDVITTLDRFEGVTKEDIQLLEEHTERKVESEEEWYDALSFLPNSLEDIIEDRVVESPNIRDVDTYIQYMKENVEENLYELNFDSNEFFHNGQLVGTLENVKYDDLSG